jgi:hypothetical protein
VSHIYRGIGGGHGAGQPDGPIGVVASEQGLLSCHEDVSCWPVDAVARDSVGRMIFTIPGEGTFVCTGALLSDADANTFAGYFLTANHCIDSQTTADSLVVYWFYQSNTCGGSVPSLLTRPKSTGATLLAMSATFGGTDSALLRFKDDPSSGQGFATWTTASPSNGSTVHGIHHPAGTQKRYSSGIVTQNSPICSSLPLTRFVYNDWTVGVTEGGSSGSPLFDAQWRLIGQLYGACFFNGTTPGCDNPQSYNNLYGRFSVFYSTISSYLAAITPDDAYEPNDLIEEAKPIDPGTHDLVLADFEDYFVLTSAFPSEITATTTFAPSAMNLNLYLLTDTGANIDFSTGSTGSETISASVPAGTNILRVTRSTGWGGAYTLNLQMVVEGCAPAPVAADPTGLPKNRYISFVPGHAGESVALRVTFDSVHVPDPPNAPDYPAKDFGSLNGRSMWVGEPFLFIDRDLPPTFGYAAPLQCEPYFADWGGYQVLHVFGPEIVPSSSYSVQALFEECDPANSSSYSASLVVSTGRWGDIAEPFQLPAPNPLIQPTVIDIGTAVDTLKDLPTGIVRTRAQLQPATLDPNTDASVVDIAFVVDGVKGFAYPFLVSPRCP